MISKLKPKSEFSRNVLTLMTGTTIAQAIPIAISPILTRIYTPEDFGVFALYMGILSVIAAIATGKYELAIMLPKDNGDAMHITVLSIYITLFVSIFSFIVIFIFNDKITNILGNSDISSWLYFIPITVLAMGIYNSLNYWLNRDKKYKDLSQSVVYRSLGTSTSSIALGFMKYGGGGMIIGQFLGQLIGTITLILKIDIKKYISLIRVDKLLSVAKRYKNFPKITAPHATFNALSQNIPVFIITYYFSTKEVGYFSLASRMVMLPISLISGAYYQVFFESFSKTNKKEQFFKSKFKQINIIFIPLFILLWFILPDLFAFIFGQEWATAGVYTQVLLPLFYLKFISNLFTSTAYIYYEKQAENFKLEITIFITSLLSLLAGVYFDSIVLGLLLMSITNGLIIFFKIYRSFLFLKS